MINSEFIGLTLLFFFLFTIVKVFICYKIEKPGRSLNLVSLIATGGIAVAIAQFMSA